MKCKLSFLRNVTNAPVYVCIIGLKVGSSIGLLNTRKVLFLSVRFVTFPVNLKFDSFSLNFCFCLHDFA